MTRKGSLAVVQIGRERVAAVQVHLRKSRVDVSSACCVVRPAEVSPDRPEELGAWVRDTLDAAGITARRAILAAARSEVVLKVLDLPGGGIADEAERCEIVRLQMARQLTMPIAESVIDWLPMAEGDEAKSESVLVGAIHDARLGWYKDVAAGAGLRPIGIALSSGGIIALTSGVEGTVLTVAPSLTGIEYVIASHQRVLFARSIDFPDVSDTEDDARAADEYAERIAVEAKRTWMSYRVSQRAEDVNAIAVVGFAAASERVRKACADLMELPGVCVGLPDSVRVASPRLVDRNGPVLPLIGLALGAGAGTPGLDFLNPRRPPDKAARRRMIGMAGVLGLIVVGGAGYLLADQKVRSLRGVEAALQEDRNRLAGEYLSYLADLARAEHIDRWDALDADYLGHVGWISAHLPEPSVSQADRVALAMAAQVRYEGTAFPGPGWSSPARLVVSVSGRVAERDVTLALRDRLLRSGPYVVANRGPDVADRYDFELSTAGLDAPARGGADDRSAAPAADGPAEAADGGGT